MTELITFIVIGLALWAMAAYTKAKDDKNK